MTCTDNEGQSDAITVFSNHVFANIVHIPTIILERWRRHSNSIQYVQFKINFFNVLMGIFQLLLFRYWEIIPFMTSPQKTLVKDSTFYKFHLRLERISFSSGMPHFLQFNGLYLMRLAEKNLAFVCKTIKSLNPTRYSRSSHECSYCWSKVDCWSCCFSSCTTTWY